MIKRCMTVDISKRPTAEELLKEEVFEMLDKNEEGDVELLDTIRCPRVLKFLNEKLPDDQYEGTKKVKTLKFIDSNEESSKMSMKNQPRSMKKIGSEANIRSISRMRSDRLISKEKENQAKIPIAMQAPFQAPKGYVKLPRIPSCKNIFWRVIDWSLIFTFLFFSLFYFV